MSRTPAFSDSESKETVHGRWFPCGLLLLAVDVFHLLPVGYVLQYPPADFLRRGAPTSEYKVLSIMKIVMLCRKDENTISSNFHISCHDL